MSFQTIPYGKLCRYIYASEQNELAIRVPLLEEL